MTVEFPVLAEMLEYDQAQRVVWEFYRWVTKDLQCLEHAAAAREWRVVRNLAHRIHLSCLHVGERDASEAAAMLAHIPGEFFVEAFHRQRPRIADSLDRAERFVGRGVAGCETWFDATGAEVARH